MPRHHSDDSAPRARGGCAADYQDIFPADVVRDLESCAESGAVFTMMDANPAPSTSAGSGAAPWVILFALFFALSA
jgi:hypothetical protein